MSIPKSKSFPDQPCERCGCIRYVHIPANPVEKSGWECAECGKGFIEDKIQPKVSLNNAEKELYEMQRDTEE